MQSRNLLSIGVLICLEIAGGVSPRRCLAQEPKFPRLFAPGTISGPADDLSPAFSPDGKTVFFTRSNGAASMILTSILSNGRWSSPEIASFSGQWSDMEPAMSPDGSFMVFASNRPIDGANKPIDGNFNHKTYAAGGGNLWRVDRAGERWGVAQRLPQTINDGTGIFSPGITSDGSIYFMRPDSSSGYFHLYRSQYRAGTYLPAVPVAVGDSTTEDVDPAVAPDERYMVYCSNHPANHEAKRLKIVFRSNEGWGSPIDLGDDVNEAGSNIEARLSPDGMTLYFSTNTVPPVSFPRSHEQAERELREMLDWANGRENIWFVSLKPWLSSTQAQRQ